MQDYSEDAKKKLSEILGKKFGNPSKISIDCCTNIFCFQLNKSDEPKRIIEIKSLDDKLVVEPVGLAPHEHKGLLHALNANKAKIPYEIRGDSYAVLVSDVMGFQESRQRNHRLFGFFFHKQENYLKTGT